jgi:hypothetical protein
MQASLGGRVLEAMIINYGMQRRFDDAHTVFDMITGPTDGPCLRAILSACSMASPPRWEEALEIIHTSDIVESATGPAKIDPRAIGFAMIACSKADEWEQAYNLLFLYGQSTPSERCVALWMRIEMCCRIETNAAMLRSTALLEEMKMLQFQLPR